MGPAGLKIRQMLLGKREMLLKVHLVVMTEHDQTLHLEVVAPDGLSEERNSTSLRKQINLATWNVRSMMEIVEEEMARCNIKILGVPELWWHGQGRFTTDNGNVCMYSGKDIGKKRMGVGFVIDKTTAKSIVGYNPVNERVITL